MGTWCEYEELFQKEIPTIETPIKIKNPLEFPKADLKILRSQ